MKKKGFTLVELLVVIAIIAMLMGILMPALNRVRQLAQRTMCGTNLKGIGTACLTYANDYEDEYPRAGGPGSTVRVAALADWDALTAAGAYGAVGNNIGQATIESCLYLLVKYADVTPKQFVCKGDSFAKEFKLSAHPTNPGGMGLTEVWNFGNEPGRLHCSYAYHTPFGGTNTFFALTAMSDPGLAICADSNPWLAPIDGAERQAVVSGSTIQQQWANTPNHQNEGQNVLFNDASTQWQARAWCGTDSDNIYTKQTAVTPNLNYAIVGVRVSPAAPPTAVPNSRTDSLCLQSGALNTGTIVP